PANDTAGSVYRHGIADPVAGKCCTGLAFERQAPVDDDGALMPAGGKPHRIALRSAGDRRLKILARPHEDFPGDRRGNRAAIAGADKGRQPYAACASLSAKRFAKRRHEVTRPSVPRACGPSSPCAWRGRTTSNSTTRPRAWSP